MKRYAIAISFLLFGSYTSIAQSNEFYIHVGSGLAGYQLNHDRFGPDFFYYGVDAPFLTRRPGSRPGASYTLSASLQLNTKSGFIYGMESGFQQFESHTNTREFESMGVSSFYLPGRYKNSIATSFININPFAGYRFDLKNWKIDLSLGFEYGLNLKRSETTEVWYDNTPGSIKMDYDHDKRKNDLRGKLRLAVAYQRLGVFVSFAHGLNNTFHKSLPLGDNDVARSRFMGAGLSFRLR